MFRPKRDQATLILRSADGKMRVTPSIVLFSYPLGFDPQYVVYDYESFVTVNNYPFLLSKGGLSSVLSFSRNGQPAILLDCSFTY